MFILAVKMTMQYLSLKYNFFDLMGIYPAKMTV